MKKSILILTAVASLLAYPAFGQTISATGTSGTIGTASGSTFDSTLSVTVSGANSIGDLKSLNMLLATPSSGANSGVSLFNVTIQSLISPYDNKNQNGTATFTTTGDANNTGNTLSSLDLGANTSMTAPTIASPGPTTVNVDILRFTSLATLTPGSVYNFFASSGGNADTLQGSWIDNTANTTFDLNSKPIFTITVVPEPATWSLFGLGAIGAFGLNLLRARRRIS